MTFEDVISEIYNYIERLPKQYVYASYSHIFKPYLDKIKHHSINLLTLDTFQKFDRHINYRIIMYNNICVYNQSTLNKTKDPIKLFKQLIRLVQQCDLNEIQKTLEILKNILPSDDQCSISLIKLQLNQQFLKECNKRNIDSINVDKSEIEHDKPRFKQILKSYKDYCESTNDANKPFDIKRNGIRLKYLSIHSPWVIDIGCRTFPATIDSCIYIMKKLDVLDYFISRLENKILERIE